MPRRKYTAKEIAVARRLWRAADEKGVIQAETMLCVAPHRPELHTITNVSIAFAALTGKEYDAEFFFNL